MRRREFIWLFGGSAFALPLTARAQQPTKLPVVGLMGVEESLQKSWIDAFVRRLSELGWVDGRTVTIEYRWGEGRHERDAVIAAEFVRDKADVIVPSGVDIALVMHLTRVIPIVFPMANDPVGAGLVARLSHPGGNVTGMSNQATDLAGKRLELLREAVPHLHRLAIMVDVSFPQAVLEMDQVKAAARTLSLDVTLLEIQHAENIRPTLAAFKTEADALYVVGDALLTANRTVITTFAFDAKLPTIFNTSRFVQAGGLMSYGPDFTDQWRRAAEYVDKILRGTKPGDLPVQQPTKFELVVNLKTAKTIGLTIPPTLLATADEVIE